MTLDGGKPLNESFWCFPGRRRVVAAVNFGEMTSQSLRAGAGRDGLNQPPYRAEVGVGSG